jgi:hypothetical protein
VCALLQHFEDVVRILGESMGVPAEWNEQPNIIERDDQRGELTFRLRYEDGSLLAVDLTADCSDDDLGVQWLSYSFHYQDRKNRQRFRYDNTPHHRTLANFPYHLHLGVADVTLPEGPPAVRDVARRVQEYLSTPV